MKIGDWVMIVPYKPMITMARPFIGQCAQIVDGPYPSPMPVDPNEHWDIGININPNSSETWWWVKHLMPIDPPEEVRDEETADDHPKKSKAPHQSKKRNRSLQPETP